jgi:uncharacterized membrane protein YcaP (DUF421 family)
MSADIWWADLSEVEAAFLVALVLYLGVVLAFRVGKRRTVAELAPFDLAAVIAVGAITGRTATGGNSVAVGVLAVLGLFTGHWVVARGRRWLPVRRVVDHPTAVLVLDGRIQDAELRRSGLTRDDLDATLRSHGIRDLREVAVAVFETRNGVSVLRPGPAASLWERILPESSTGPE